MRGTRAVALLALGSFAMGTDAYAMAGLLPAIGSDLHVPVSLAGQSVTAFTLCYALAAPLLSAVLARWGTRTVLVTALVVFVLANAGTALTGSYAGLLGTRALAGAGAGLFTPAAATAAGALVPPERRGRALGLVLGGMSAGTVLGVPLGLLVAGHSGWRTALWLITGLGTVALLGVATRLPAVRGATAPSLGARARALARPRVAVVVAVTFTQTVASLGLYTYLEPVLRRSADIGSAVPYLWVWGIGGVCGSLLAGTLVDRSGRPALLAVVLLGTLGAALLALPWAGGPPGLIMLPLLVWGAVGWAFVVPQQHRLLGGDGEGGAAAIGLNSSATYLGGAVGSALGGLALARGLDARWLPLPAAGVACAGVLLHLTAVRVLARRTADPARTTGRTTGHAKGTGAADATAAEALERNAP
ncbi:MULTISPECIES: MFS transporter [unclassified Streptomyces]|uniref:MFS transporter n=1 Tax=unclassified Streptomyces TaxID=2593676 RepID=UPI0007012217|nr:MULTISPECIES: MFS transporter [unclassified Streptomyces]KQX56145.1 MFS transporter [Streptomyces sp. Root1304]KRA96961.1 MFS transporter [Streptomyces sp. Root66D1]